MSLTLINRISNWGVLGDNHQTENHSAQFDTVYFRVFSACFNFVAVPKRSLGLIENNAVHMNVAAETSENITDLLKRFIELP